MDTKNIIAAISLSLAIIVMWSLFFQPSPEEIKKRKEKEKIVNSNDAPNIDVTEKAEEELPGIGAQILNNPDQFVR